MKNIKPMVIRLFLLFAFIILSWTLESKTFTQITFDPAQDYYPSSSPDGSTIAFYSRQNGNADIWTIPAKGGKATQITTHPGYDGTPSWSPDGTKIVFCSSRSGNLDIWVIDFKSKTEIKR